MTPRRFLFATIGYPPFVGGAQSYVRLLAESLVKDGNRVTVLTSDAAEVERIWDPHKRALPPGVSQLNGVVVKRLPLRYLPGAPLSHYGVQRLKVALARRSGVSESTLWRLARVTPWIPGLQRALREERTDIVHGFAIPFESVLNDAADCAAEKGVPFIVTPFLHAGPPDDPAVRRSYTMPHQLGLLRRAAAVVALTDVERDVLVAGLRWRRDRSMPPHPGPGGQDARGPAGKMPALPDERPARPIFTAVTSGGVNPAKVHVIPAGIPASSTCSGPLPEKPRILFLGALTHEKGAVHLVEAVRQLWREGTGVGLTLAGNTTAQFSAYVNRLPPGDRERLDLPGIVSEERKRELILGCTALALPSRVDSFGLVLLEAWECGRPVIGAHAGGIPAVVDDGVNGLLVPFGDVPALSGAIRRLGLDGAEATRLGAAGQGKLAQRYTWDRVYPELVRLYERVS